LAGKTVEYEFCGTSIEAAKEGMVIYRLWIQPI